MDQRAIRLGTLAVTCLCAPTVLGVAAVVATKIARPGNAMPLETPTDRLLVDVFVWATPIAALGLPLALAGVVLGIWLAWKAGPWSSTGKIMLLSIALTVGSAAYLIRQFAEAASGLHRR